VGVDLAGVKICFIGGRGEGGGSSVREGGMRRTVSGRGAPIGISSNQSEEKTRSVPQREDTQSDTELEKREKFQCYIERRERKRTCTSVE